MPRQVLKVHWSYIIYFVNEASSQNMPSRKMTIYVNSIQRRLYICKEQDIHDGVYQLSKAFARRVAEWKNTLHVHRCKNR